MTIFSAVDRTRLAGHRAGEGRFVGRIHIGRRRGEFGRAGIDALEHGPHAEAVAQRPHLGLGTAGERREARIGKARGLQHAQIGGIGRQAMGPDARLEIDDFLQAIDVPMVDLARLVDSIVVHAEPQRLRDDEQPVGRGCAERATHDIHVVADAEPLDFDLVEAGQSGLQRAQSLLQGFGERAADRHDLADRFHGGRQDRLGAGKLFKGEARNLGHHIIDRRLERGRRRAAGDVVGDLVERVADGELRRHFGDRETGRLRGESRGARHARIHFDDDHLAVLRIDRELHVRTAGLDADLAQHRDRGVAHDLIFLVGQRQGRRDGDRIPGMHAHRIDILDRADDDAIVRLVADDLHFVFFPAEHALLDQHLAGRGSIDAAFDDVDEFGLVVSDAAAGATEREGRPDDRRQADVVERGERLRQRLDLVRARRRQPDPRHRLAEELAILRLVDRRNRRADHHDVEFFQHPHLVQRQGAIERRLAAHGGQQGEAAGHRITFLLDDLGDDLRRDRLDIGAVGQIGVGHDRRRIGIDEDDPIAFGAQGLAGLRAGIIEFASLPDDDGAGADDQDGRNVSPLRHIDPCSRRHASCPQANDPTRPAPAAVRTNERRERTETRHI